MDALARDACRAFYRDSQRALLSGFVDQQVLAGPTLLNYGLQFNTDFWVAMFQLQPKPAARAELECLRRITDLQRDCRRFCSRSTASRFIRAQQVSKKPPKALSSANLSPEATRRITPKYGRGVPLASLRHVARFS